MIAGLSLAFADYMVIGLVLNDVQPQDYYSILGAFLLGFFSCRLCMILKASTLQSQTKGFWYYF
jgi:hypothetical protein